MKCFNHPHRDAVGFCTVCFKAVCRECVGQSEGKLVCKECVGQPSTLAAPAPAAERPAGKQAVAKQEAQGKAEAAAKKPAAPPGKGLFQKTKELIFPHAKNLPYMKETGSALLSPIVFIGLICGILAGIPLLNLLSPLILVVGVAFGIILMRAEDDFASIVRPRDGAVLGFFSSLLAAFISTLILIALSAFLGATIYALLSDAMGSLDPKVINFILMVAGIHEQLNYYSLGIRLALTMVLFPLFGAIGGALAAKYMR